MNLNSPTSVTAPAEPETSQPEHTMPSSSSEQIAMILERMKVLAAEQVSLSETIRKSLDQSEAQRQASKDANKIMTDVKSSLTEVKKINDQGFSELTRQYSEKLERIEKKMSEIMATMLELTIKISNLKVLTMLLGSFKKVFTVTIFILFQFVPRVKRITLAASRLFIKGLMLRGALFLRPCKRSNMEHIRS